MGSKEDIAKATALSKSPDLIRNIGTAAHIDHGKTTLSDNLIAGAGMMSSDLAGKQLMLDFDEQEQARGITINAANASMVHSYKGKEYLINLIDTPGHVDFGGTSPGHRGPGTAASSWCAPVDGKCPDRDGHQAGPEERVRPVLPSTRSIA